MRRLIIIFLLLTLIGPLWVIWSKQIDFGVHWRTATRASAHIAPDPKVTSEAVIQVYFARTYNWRGIFATHTWMAVKSKNANQYMVYQVIGWRYFSGMSALMAEPDIPDRYWFAQTPKIIFDARGKEAEKIIPKLVKAVAAYPLPNQYDYWPGPNSNTFISYVARQVPEMRLVLPSNAIGKDYLPEFSFFARAPSGTGFQFSLFGIFGIMLALDEGLEINILGLVYGISPTTFTIKLPGIGDIKLGVK